MQSGVSNVSGKREHQSGKIRWSLIIALLVVAGIVIAGIVPRMRAKAALAVTTDELSIPTVVVLQPKEGSPQTEIVLPGTIEAFEDSPIYSRTDGYLKEWYFDIGAHVKKGQLLAEIETPEVDQQLDQARADLKTAQANFELSQITANRYEDLAKSDSVSKQDVDNAVGDFEAKRAMVASAQSNVNRLEQLQSFEKIYAPFDGVITARNTDVGHLINAGAGSTPGSELFHEASIDKLRVYINVPQQYSVAAKPGLSATLELQQFPGKTFKGTLVRTADSIDLASRTLLTEVDVNNPTGELLPGAFTQVHLKVPTTVPSVIIPVTALIFRAQGLQAAVVNDGQHAELRNITLGRDYGNEVEVISGLTTQDRVMVNPPDSIVDGEEVRISQDKSTGPSPEDQQSAR
ncbi:MAG TPA: efflux RND transporter periplasmic adaptor subunit [Candidatus Aquilonibacter sp.]|nr:efflux RND transporter periplasmic adaptor subunit [Candidatus Aquilonibacter sp.]